MSKVFLKPNKTDGGDSCVEIEHQDGGVAVLLLSKPPVNTFDVEMARSLSTAIQALQRDERVKAIVLMSKNPKVMSGGMDLNVMYEPVEAEFRELWEAFEDTTKRLYTFNKPTIVAISGKAPAASAVLSLHCDYRYASKNASIGFNEAQLNIALPSWLLTNAERIVGGKNAERMLQLGPMMTAEQALQIGLVDKVAEDYDGVKSLAIQEAKRMGKLWTIASATVKENQHKNIAKLFNKESVDYMWGQFSSQPVQEKFAAFFKK